MNSKGIWNEAKQLVDSAIEEDDIESLKLANVRLIKKLQRLGINNLQLTNLGNSISLGYSKDGIVKPLFDRNDSLDKVSDHYSFKVIKYIFARNSSNIYNCHIENIDRSTANIIIYDGLLLRKKHIMKGIKNDLYILENFLANVESSNREYNLNTQVYVSGIPNIKIFNNLINKKVKMFANANYIKPVDCDIFDKLKFNFKYNEQQYRRYNKQIINDIDENYLFTSALIDIDRNNNEEVINKWLIILKENYCDLDKFKKKLIEYKKNNDKELTKNK